MNSIVLVGRLTKDPELKYLQGEGTAVAQFTLAVDRGYVKKDSNKEADFILIEAWNKMAENIAKYCTKGSLVSVNGNLRIEKYMYKDEKRSIAKVRANQVNFLSTKNSTSQNNNGNGPVFEPQFEVPGGLDPNGFQAIDDEEIPF